MKIYAVGLIRAKMLVVELVRVDLKPIRGKITKLSNGLNMQEWKREVLRMAPRSLSCLSVITKF